jgi:hypothetical protein
VEHSALPAGPMVNRLAVDGIYIPCLNRESPVVNSGHFSFFAFEVYESAWLRKRKEKMNKELEEKYQDSGRPPADS